MVHLHKAYYNTTKTIDIFDASHDAKRAQRDSQINNGLLTVYIPGAGGGAFILENDPTLRESVKKLIESLVPSADQSGARPSRRSGSGAEEVHVRAALCQQSLGIPIKDGKLLLGAWQEIIVYDFDDKVGRREVFFHVIGDKEEKKA